MAAAQAFRARRTCPSVRYCCACWYRCALVSLKSTRSDATIALRMRQFSFGLVQLLDSLFTLHNVKRLLHTWALSLRACAKQTLPLLDAQRCCGEMRASPRRTVSTHVKLACPCTPALEHRDQGSRERMWCACRTVRPRPATTGHNQGRSSGLSSAR